MRGTRYGDFSRFIIGLRTVRRRCSCSKDGSSWTRTGTRRPSWPTGALPAPSPTSSAPAARLAADTGIRDLAAGAPGVLRPRGDPDPPASGARTAPHGSFTIEMRVQWAGGAGTLIDLAGERDEHGERGERGNRGGRLRLSVRDDGILVFSQHPSGGSKQARVRSSLAEEPLTGPWPRMPRSSAATGKQASGSTRGQVASRRLARTAAGRRADGA